MKKVDFSKLFENKYVQIIIGMAKAIAASFIPYLFLVFTVAAGANEIYSKSFSDFLASCLVAILFSWFYHIFYTTKQNKEYSYQINIKEKFSYGKELRAYLKSDGIPFLCVYAVLAPFNILFRTIYYFWQIDIPLSVITFFLFPFQSGYNHTIPLYIYNICAPLTSSLVIFPLILFFAVQSRKKLYEKYS